MKKILLPALSIGMTILASCSQDTDQLANTEIASDVPIHENNPLSCTTKKLTNNSGIKIICNGDSIGVVYNGKDGVNGKDGTNGKDGEKGERGDKGTDGLNGTSCTIFPIEGMNAHKIICNGDSIGVLRNGEKGEKGEKGETGATGTKGEKGDAGADGKDGIDGKNGVDGKDGKGCTSTTVTDSESGKTGVKVQCGENTEPVYVWNGDDGEKGDKGDSGASCTTEAVTDTETGRTGVAITCDENSEPVYVWNGIDGKDGETQSSSSVEESSSSEDVLSNVCLKIRATTNTFFPIQDVFSCVKSKEKAVFIVRHAERNKDDTHSSNSLNSNGFSQANYVGQNIGALNLGVDIYYWHTNSRRTMETASRISRGAGESNFFDESTFGNCYSGKGNNENTDCINEHHEYNNDMVGSWFDKCDGEGDDWKTYAKAAYEPEKCENSTKPDVVAKTNDFVNTYIKNKFNDLHKYTIAISHDQFIVSAVAAISNRQIDFNYHNYNWGQTGFMHWPNYLAGLAVIINEAKDVIYIPVRGLNSGFFGDHCKNRFENGYPCSVWP